MAQTKRKRRRKHRGTQGGSIDNRRRGRPRNRAEARARAQQRQKQRGPRTAGPPTWGSAFRKGLVAAAIFFALLALAFQRPIGASVLLAAFMLVFYVPMGYMTDRFFYNRQLRREQRERMERANRDG